MGSGGPGDPESGCQLQCHRSSHLSAKLCEVFLLGPELLGKLWLGRSEPNTAKKIANLKVTPLSIFICFISGLCTLHGRTAPGEASPRPEFCSCSDRQCPLGPVTFPSIGLSFLLGKWGHSYLYLSLKRHVLRVSCRRGLAPDGGGDRRWVGCDANSQGTPRRARRQPHKRLWSMIVRDARIVVKRTTRAGIQLGFLSAGLSASSLLVAFSPASTLRADTTNILVSQVLRKGALEERMHVSVETCGV